LAHVAATGAFIHNQAALLASQGAPIAASDISLHIQEVIRKLLK
jgi:NAD(P)H-hydrate repair Nnr-like enzyme with NAD(P)H-hydrate dehydratase domain